MTTKRDCHFIRERYPVPAIVARDAAAEYVAGLMQDRAKAMDKLHEYAEMSAAGQMLSALEHQHKDSLYGYLDDLENRIHSWL